MNLHAALNGFDPRHFSRRKAREVAVEIIIVVAALLLWALLSHVNSPPFRQAGAAGGCVFLGRAGSHCVGSASGADAGAPSPRGCEFLGRAGDYCPPETPSH
jgi:hypothetical protein